MWNILDELMTNNHKPQVVNVKVLTHEDMDTMHYNQSPKCAPKSIFPLATKLKTRKGSTLKVMDTIDTNFTIN